MKTLRNLRKESAQILWQFVKESWADKLRSELIKKADKKSKVHLTNIGRVINEVFDI